MPKKFFLSDNCPNPFNEDTRIEYHVLEVSYVSIEIYDLLDRYVKTLVEGQHPPGVRVVVWDTYNEYGNKKNSGIYVVRMRTATFKQMFKLIY